MSAAPKALIFDCQLLQTKAWHRGMGKYTSKLLNAFMADKVLSGEYESIVFLFNEKLAFSAELEAFVAGNPGATVKHLALDVPVDGDQHAITLAQRTNRIMLDNYINETFPGYHVAFCITSLFLDEACPTFPSNSYNSVIFYDLIPLMYYRLYLGLGVSEQYFTRFSVLFTAHQVFAISETVANDLVTFLGIPKEKIVNIRGASNHTIDDRIAENPNLEITKPYILMPTGGDPRKNNLNGVKGFQQFNEQNDNKYLLVITSIFTDAQKAELHTYCPNLLFTDNVSDHELWWLYENAQTVLFPTEYEGLGMPILEAIDAKKTIVCSDIPVFREISTTAFYMFDPSDPQAMCSSLEEAVIATKADIALKMKQYPLISEQYTWESTAQIVAGRIFSEMDNGLVIKPRIAIVTPNLCQPSEEARFIALQYASLAEYFDIDFYYDINPSEHLVRPSYHAFTTETHDLRELTQQEHDTFDLVVYFVGNSSMFTKTLQAALALPGLVILADATVERAYENALLGHTMSQERFDRETGKYISSLEKSAMKVVTTSLGGSDKATLIVQANKPVYNIPKERGLYNRIFIDLDSSRGDDEWNIDFVNDIASTVDKSKVMFSVVTRTRFSDIVFSKLRQSSITLYEEVSDHEYNTLLSGSDLYIDARPGVSLTKLSLASQAEVSGLDVFMNEVPHSNGWVSKHTYHAIDGSDLRDATYRWLIGGALEHKAASAKKTGKTLTQLIQETLTAKSTTDN